MTGVGPNNFKSLGPQKVIIRPWSWEIISGCITKFKINSPILSNDNVIFFTSYNCIMGNCYWLNNKTTEIILFFGKWISQNTTVPNMVNDSMFLIKGYRLFNNLQRKGLALLIYPFEWLVLIWILSLMPCHLLLFLSSWHSQSNQLFQLMNGSENLSLKWVNFFIASHGGQG